MQSRIARGSRRCCDRRSKRASLFYERRYGQSHIPTQKGIEMAEFPPLVHVALTVRDLSVSVPWYQALFDSSPVLDEDTTPDMHHTVYLVGNGTLIGLHQHKTPAPAGQFSEYNVGLDHIGFGCANRG